MKKIIFQKLITNLSVDKIKVSKQNARKTKIESGIGELKTSIDEMSLIQPVVVIPKGENYELIVGQRRFLATKALGRKTIPALVIEPMDDTSQSIMSFGENIHRKKLPYEDTINICDELYNEDNKGTKSDRINKIVKTLGLSPSTVKKYLAYKLIPKEVKQLVSDGKLSQDVAHRITAAYFPNTQRIISLAKTSARLTKSETRRAIEFGIKKPNASIEDIMAYAKNPPPTVEITIQVEPDTEEILKELARKKKSTITDLVIDAIDRMIEDET